MAAAMMLLAALVAIGAQATAGENYLAFGTEPFWSVDIENGRMTYDAANGPNFSVPAPAPTQIYNGRLYAADRLVLNLTHAQCSDGMSDNIYADTVTVTVDGVTHRGCGGGTVPPGTMANSHWSIDEIDSEPLFEHGYFLEFDAERFTGRAGCNRLLGAYARDGDRLTLGPIAATRMACPEPGMGHERRVLAILGGPLTVSTPDEGDGLILTGANGRLLLRQIVN